MSGAVFRTVGVIGGMGPAATNHFLQVLLALTPAGGDADHLRVLTDNNPHVPDRNAALAGEGPSPGPVLAEMARGLERAGAGLLVMPCNTAHAFQADIEAAVSAPFLSIIDATVAEALAHGTGPVGLLAAPGCLRARLYQEAFAARGVETVAPEGSLHDRLRAAIYRVKAGDTSVEARAEMRAVARALLEQGATTLAAACTEVPLLLSQDEIEAPLVDSTAALARAVIAFA